MAMSPDEGRNHLPGVAIDEQNWTAHLGSSIGGAWDSSEVRILRNPLPVVLSAALIWTADADYTLIAFSGHGEGKSDHETELQVHPSHTFPASRVASAASKQTIVLDCCREPRKEIQLEASLEKKYATDARHEPSDARRRFDEHLKKCAPFRVTLNSCAFRQVAGENEVVGGFYTNELLKAARLASPGKVMDVRDSHKLARAQVMHRQPSQTPVGNLPRDGDTFPLGLGF
jgi:hypothetical protein